MSSKDFPLDKLLPTGGVIRNHMELFFPSGRAPITEAPPQFVYAAILSAIGTVIGKKAWIPWHNNSNLYCNLFVLLVGESTLTRKTTCVKMCEHYLSDMTVADPSIAPFRLPSSGSPEGIFEELSRRPQGIFIYSEFSALTGLLEKKYASDLKGIFTDLYDCGTPITRTLTNKRVITISNYYINLFAGTAIDWFDQASKQSDFTSGWYTRFLFVWGEDTGLCICFPPPMDLQVRKIIVSDLLQISKMRPGAMKFTKDAQSTYEQWYTMRRKMEISDTKTMDVRLFDYTVKISMINALSRLSDTISEEDMKRATVFTEWLMNNNKGLMGEYISFSPWDSSIKKIRHIIARHPKISRRDLMRKTHLISKHIDICLITLIERDEIEIIESDAARGRPTTHYRMKP